MFEARADENSDLFLLLVQMHFLANFSYGGLLSRVFSQLELRGSLELHLGIDSEANK